MLSSIDVILICEKPRGSNSARQEEYRQEEYRQEEYRQEEYSSLISTIPHKTIETNEKNPLPSINASESGAHLGLNIDLGERGGGGGEDRS